MEVVLINGNAERIPLRDKSVHCVATSPPYWGHRDYGIDGQVGMQSSPLQYVEDMVMICREIWRVLRDDGTFWLNLADSYASATKGTGGPTKKQVTNSGSFFQSRKFNHGLKEKDLVGIPWRVALALQDDGWWLRSDVIWHKTNPMPESVRDRPTKSHEYIFLLTKNKRYFYDADAIAEDTTTWSDTVRDRDVTKLNNTPGRSSMKGLKTNNYSKRNKRSVWTFPTKPYKGAHFAVFPPALPELCIKAGTSEKGVCPACGAPWERKTKRTRLTRPELPKNDPRYRPNTYDGAYKDINGKADAGYTVVETVGWEPTCKCDIRNSVPATVLDPFVGSGTTLLVARDLGRNGVGIDLSYDYLYNQARKRLGL